MQEEISLKQYYKITFLLLVIYMEFFIIQDVLHLRNVLTSYFIGILMGAFATQYLKNHSRN